jgi:glycerol-3-phosphate dehydrogenase (NAD(P)+)
MGYIAVIGAGSWGTTLAHLLGGKGFDVTLWAYEKEIHEEINRSGENSVYLPGVKLSDNVVATGDLQAALSRSRFIINVVPTQFARRVFSEAAQHIPEGAVIVQRALSRAPS